MLMLSESTDDSLVFVLNLVSLSFLLVLFVSWGPGLGCIKFATFLPRDTSLARIPSLYELVFSSMGDSSEVPTVVK